MAEIEDLTPEEVDEQVKAGAVLIDVREPAEYAAERIAGSKLVPLSSLNASAIPTDRPVIFQCGTGKRSAMAVHIVQQAGLQHSRHLRGGLQAWKAAGLPVEKGGK
jgi:rhodanese-related sulfurtransferase